MLHRACAGVAGTGAAGVIAFLIAALTQPSTSDASKWLWIGAGICIVVALGGAIGWLLTQGGSPPPEVKAEADNQSAAVAAGRDLTFRDLIMAPGTPAPKSRALLSFDLSCPPSVDGWVHLLLSNFSEPGEFHVDVTKVEGAASHETTPFPAKWRGTGGEDRRVVKETLIDLARIDCPQRDKNDPISGLVFVGTRPRKGDWYRGQFQLFSHFKQDGWWVDPIDRDPVNSSMPSYLTLFLDEIKLHVRATRIDSGEEIARIVTLGFDWPKWNEERQRWDTPTPNIRVEIETVSSI